MRFAWPLAVSPHPVDNPRAKYLGVTQLPGIKSDESIAAFARAATVLKLVIGPEGW